MLEYLRIPHYYWTGQFGAQRLKVKFGSDNVMGAGNQQERPRNKFLESSETVRQTLKSEDTVRPA